MKILGKFATLTAVLVGLSIPALAQDMRAASEKVVACQSIEEASARLTCFEAAADELSAVLSAPVQQAVAVPVPSTPTAPAEQATSSPEAPVQQAAVSGADAPIQQAATDVPATPEAPQSSLPSWIPRITFGSGRDVEKEPDEYTTQLTRVQVNRIGRHFFTTSDGLVWKQRNPEEIRAPSTLPADIVISQSITGGLRLKIVETNRTYAVQRVE